MVLLVVVKILARIVRTAVRVPLTQYVLVEQAREDHFHVFLKVFAHERVDDGIHETVSHGDPMAKEIGSHEGVVLETGIDLQEVGLEVDENVEYLNGQPAQCKHAYDDDEHFEYLEKRVKKRYKSERKCIDFKLETSETSLNLANKVCFPPTSQIYLAIQNQLESTTESSVQIRSGIALHPPHLNQWTKNILVSVFSLNYS